VLLGLCLFLAGSLYAQGSPELVVQPASAAPCERAAFSHDGSLLATNSSDETMLWEVSTGRLLKIMKPYRSPRIQHLKTGGILSGAVAAKGSLVFSPDDKTLAVLPMDFDRIISFGPQDWPPLLWNIDTGLPVTTGLWSLDSGVARNDAAPSTPEVEAWTVSGNRQPVAQLLQQGMKVQAISADGRIAASRNEQPIGDQHIQLIDPRTGQVLSTLDTTFSFIDAMALSPDGKYFAAHSGNRQFVTIWDTSSGKIVTEINHASPVGSWLSFTLFSPDGKWLAVQYGSQVVLYDTATWQPSISLTETLRSTEYGQLAFSPDSKLLAIAGESVSLMDVETGKVTETVCAPQTHRLKLMAWSEKSGTLALATDQLAKTWPADSRVPPLVLKPQPSGNGDIDALAISDDGRFLALGRREQYSDARGNEYVTGDTLLWQTQSPPKATALAWPDETPSGSPSAPSSNSLAFTPGGNTLAAAMTDTIPCPSSSDSCIGDEIVVGLITLWDTSTGKLLRKRRQPDPVLNAVAFSPVGSQIATAQQAELVKIYDSSSLNRMYAFLGPEQQPSFGINSYDTSALAYSPDGKLLLAGSTDGFVWLLDATGTKTVEVLREATEPDATEPTYQEPPSAIVSVFFSRQGDRAYAVESNGTVWLWNRKDWSSAGKYETPRGAVSAALSPNGNVIAIANADGATRFYDAETGKSQLVMASTDDPDSQLSVASDGRYDFGRDSDLALAQFRVGRTTVRVDQLPGHRRVRGLLSVFLRQAASPAAP